MTQLHMIDEKCPVCEIALPARCLLCDSRLVIRLYDLKDGSVLTQCISKTCGEAVYCAHIDENGDDRNGDEMVM